MSVHHALHISWLLASWLFKRVVQGKAILVRADHSWLDFGLNFQDVALSKLQSLKDLLNIILNFDSRASENKVGVRDPSMSNPCIYNSMHFIYLLNTFILYYIWVLHNNLSLILILATK